MKIKKRYLIIILILGIIYFLINKLTGFGFKCLFFEVTGLYCPGCGITRMFFSIISLDFYQAFRYNPLVFILLIGYIIYLVINHFKKIKISKYFVYVILVIVVLFGVVRNIDFFSYLRPTELNVLEKI